MLEWIKLAGAKKHRPQYLLTRCASTMIQLMILRAKLVHSHMTPIHPGVEIMIPVHLLQAPPAAIVKEAAH